MFMSVTAAIECNRKKYKPRYVAHAFDSSCGRCIFFNLSAKNFSANGMTMMVIMMAYRSMTTPPDTTPSENGIIRSNTNTKRIPSTKIVAK
jgi:hypothetical protein